MTGDESDEIPPPAPPSAVYATTTTTTTTRGVGGSPPWSSSNRQHHRNNTDFSALTTDSSDDECSSPRFSYKNKTDQAASQFLPLDDKNKVQLSDVKIRAPLEMEAESAILQVIQEERLETKHQRQHQDFVLPHLSEEMAESIRDHEDEKKGEEQSRLTSEDGATAFSRRKTRRRVVLEPPRRSIMDVDNSLAKQLADLSKDITDAHAKADALVDEDTIRDDNDTNERDRLLPKTNAQKMVDNARVLFLRSSKSIAADPLSSIKEEADDVEGGGGLIDAERGGASGNKNTTATNKEGQRPAKRFHGWKGRFKKNVEEQKANVEDFQDFLVANRLTLRKQLLFVLVAITFLLSVAAILFYGVDNPLAGDDGPSVSWILILIARHVVLYGMAMATELVVIGYLSLDLGWTVRVLGPFGALCLVQSKGAPFRMMAWAFYSTFMLTGGGRFSQHWLYYQSPIHMFNDRNPPGNTLSSRAYLTAVFGVGFGVGFAMVVKRVWWGLRVGRETYQRFGKTLIKLLHQMLLVSKVSNLSKRLTQANPSPNLSLEAVFSYEGGSKSTEDKLGSFRTAESKNTTVATALDVSHSALLTRMLGEWEEPDVAEGISQEPVSLRAMVEFKQAVSLLESGYPFSLAFGPAETRAQCVDSAQRVYERLLRANPQCEVLQFDTIASLAVLEDGTLDREKLRAFIKLFRPDRDGNLTKIDFVKSIDHVWKEMRLQQASIRSAAQIHDAFERIVNFVFYFLVAFIVIAVLGFNPVSFMMSLSTLIVGFAFMIGNASAKYFEGLLLILARRPYDVGELL
jgi:hypothetical protein